MGKTKFLRTSLIIGFMAIIQAFLVTGVAEARCCVCHFDSPRYLDGYFYSYCGTGLVTEGGSHAQWKCSNYCQKHGRVSGTYDARDCEFNSVPPCDKFWG